MKKNLKRSKAFTLIELLVVITIIGILASLAIPTIGAALDKANQTKDINNIKQTGTILFMDANDNSGVFRAGPAAGGVYGTSTAMFRDMLADGTLTTATVLAGTGLKVSPDPTALVSANVAWDYMQGLKTSSSPNVPLLVSFGTGAAVADLLSKADFNIAGVAPATSLWGKKGVVVYYLGGNSKFLSPGKEGAAANKVKFVTADIVEAAVLVKP